jgi:hypothetical protein
LGRILVEPFEGEMPYGGTRYYHGKPRHGTWQASSGGGRFIFTYRQRTLRVARLVCEAFHGEPTPETPVCMHIDENATNNRPDNLRWGTQKENLNAPGFIEYCRNRRRPW